MKYFTIIFILFCSASYADQWYENGKPVESGDFRGSVGEFAAIIIMTTDSEKALENWMMSTPGVYIPSAEKVQKGKPIEALVMFSGCKANESGNCVAEVDYKIIKPDGTLYAEYKNTELWKHKPAVPVGRLGLSVDRVGLIAEVDDPLGVYKVKCHVRDVVSSKSFSIFSTFEVVE